MTQPDFSPLGDTAITVTLGTGISDELSDRVIREARSIRGAKIAGVRDVVPAYASLTVHYDASTIAYLDLRDAIRSVMVNPASQSEAPTGELRTHRISVRYDGIDLPEVAERTGISVEEVIRIHEASRYRVFVIGFVPGFAYLGPLSSQLALPRRESPRKRVPAGSVAIAELQTGIYPSETPGGWHIIGTTAARMFDPLRSPPALLEVGDAVQFERLK